VTLRKDRFDASEMDFYEALYTQSQAQFGTYIEAGTVLNNYAHVFELLIRLRQARPPARLAAAVPPLTPKPPARPRGGVMQGEQPPRALPGGPSLAAQPSTACWPICCPQFANHAAMLPRCRFCSHDLVSLP